MTDRPSSAAVTADRWSVPATPCPEDGPWAPSAGHPTAEPAQVHSPAPLHAEGPPGGDAPRLARQCNHGLVAHSKLGCPVLSLHSVRHGGGDFHGIASAVRASLFVHFCQPLPYDRVCQVSRHTGHMEGGDILPPTAGVHIDAGTAAGLAAAAGSESEPLEAVS